MDVCPINKNPCPHARVVHITEINDGRVTEQHLCQNCAGQVTGETLVKKEPATPAIPPGFLALMKAIMAKPLTAAPQVPSHPPCPNCGTTTNDIVQSGRLGCAECYVHFQAGVASIIARCQMGATHHVGKIPKKRQEDQEKRQAEKEAALDKKEQIRNLKLKMAKAIEVENYEVAGVLKEKIEKLERLQE